MRAELPGLAGSEAVHWEQSLALSSLLRAVQGHPGPEQSRGLTAITSGPSKSQPIEQGFVERASEGHGAWHRAEEERNPPTFPKLAEVSKTDVWTLEQKEVTGLSPVLRPQVT
jgi:hypothetical protein